METAAVAAPEAAAISTVLVLRVVTASGRACASWRLQSRIEAEISKCFRRSVVTVDFYHSTAGTARTGAEEKKGISGRGRRLKPPHESVLNPRPCNHTKSTDPDCENRR